MKTKVSRNNGELKNFFKKSSYNHSYTFKNLYLAMNESSKIYRMEEHFIYNQYLSELSMVKIGIFRDIIDFFSNYFYEEIDFFLYDKRKAKLKFVELAKCLFGINSTYKLVFDDDKNNLLTHIISTKIHKREDSKSYLYLMSYLTNFCHYWEIPFQKVKFSFQNINDLQKFIFYMDKNYLSFLRIKMNPKFFYVEGLLIDDKFDINNYYSECLGG